MDKGISLNAWYSLSKAKGLGGQGVDELTTNLVQDSTQPVRRRAVGSGGAHRRAPQDHAERGHPAAVGRLRLADLPLSARRCRCTSGTGYDVNADGVNNDIYPTAFKLTGVDDNGVPSFKEIGACENVNCGRGAALSQFNLRVSKVFRLPRGMNIEAIAEGFNLFNAINPALRGWARRRRAAFFTGTAANHPANALFMKPTLYAGDAGQPEQRVASSGSGLRSSSDSGSVRRQEFLERPGLFCAQDVIFS